MSQIEQMWSDMEAPPTDCSNVLLVEVANQKKLGLKRKGWIILNIVEHYQSLGIMQFILKIIFFSSKF